MEHTLVGDTKHRYPTELAFTFPLLMTAILVLLPSLLMLDLSESRLYQILWGNWISPFILWFFAASAIYLLLKKRKLKQEMHTSQLMISRVIPAVLEGSPDKIASAELFRRLREGLIQIFPTANRWNILLSRCRLFLGHDAKSDDEEAEFFEREYMRASYALPRFMIWAIPILGFIGTVWGISNGIAGFSNAMTSVNSVAEVSATLKDTLPIVTRSLAAAFDTTFLALLLSIPLMLMMTWFEKAEENYIITLDEFWLYDLKPKLSARMEQTMQQSSGGAQESINEELRLLAAQVGALQKTMEDLYETVFASSLNLRGD
jgi:biopolymer transport protein ExbB/TolQ